MATRCLIKPGTYHDSVTLMEVAEKVSHLPAVQDAALVMATDANKGILRAARLLLPAIEAATVHDLVIVVKAESVEAAQRGLEFADAHLAQSRKARATRPGIQPRTIRGAVRSAPHGNLAIISVAGQYAAAEAWEALKNGLHVLLFSDNVPIHDEIALKEYAMEHGLLMMGPGCGTAIINGVALGFANVVPRGPVGVVAAAGTGLQEVTTILARLGVGTHQAIGTGGRDLKEEVGGIMMLEGLAALQDDPQAEVLLVVSKPPSPMIADRVLAQVKTGQKPAVVCFLGGDPARVLAAGAIPACTLQEAAYLAAGEVEGYAGPKANEEIERESAALLARAVELKKRLQPGQRYLRGLFSGGTLAAEALVLWEDMIGGVFSNVAFDAQWQLKDTAKCVANCALDLGEEEFTVGRPHPMIDNDLRVRRMMQEAADPEVGVIVLDVVLGYGAHPDPAGELGPAIARAREFAAKQGRELLVIASITGTREDPQGLERQRTALEDAAAIVCSCNAAAARLAGFIVAP